MNPSAKPNSRNPLTVFSLLAAGQHTNPAPDALDSRIENLVALAADDSRGDIDHGNQVLRMLRDLLSDIDHQLAYNARQDALRNLQASLPSSRGNAMLRRIQFALNERVFNPAIPCLQAAHKEAGTLLGRQLGQRFDHDAWDGLLTRIDGEQSSSVKSVRLRIALEALEIEEAAEPDVTGDMIGNLGRLLGQGTVTAARSVTPKERRSPDLPDLRNRIDTWFEFAQFGAEDNQSHADLLKQFLTLCREAACISDTSARSAVFAQLRSRIEPLKNAGGGNFFHNIAGILDAQEMTSRAEPKSISRPVPAARRKAVPDIAPGAVTPRPPRVEARLEPEQNAWVGASACDTVWYNDRPRDLNDVRPAPTLDERMSQFRHLTDALRRGLRVAASTVGDGDVPRVYLDLFLMLERWKAPPVLRECVDFELLVIEQETSLRCQDVLGRHAPGGRRPTKEQAKLSRDIDRWVDEMARRPLSDFEALETRLIPQLIERIQGMPDDVRRVLAFKLGAGLRAVSVSPSEPLIGACASRLLERFFAPGFEVTASYELPRHIEPAGLPS